MAFPVAVRRLPRSATAISALRVRYPDGRGILREVIAETTSRGFDIDDMATEPVTPGQTAGRGETAVRMVEVTLHVHGRHPVTDLAAALSDLSGVDAVLATDTNAIDE